MGMPLSLFLYKQVPNLFVLRLNCRAGNEKMTNFKKKCFLVYGSECFFFSIVRDWKDKAPDQQEAEAKRLALFGCSGSQTDGGRVRSSKGPGRGTRSFQSPLGLGEEVRKKGGRTREAMA